MGGRSWWQYRIPSPFYTQAFLLLSRSFRPSSFLLSPLFTAFVYLKTQFAWRWQKSSSFGYAGCTTYGTTVPGTERSWFLNYRVETVGDLKLKVLMYFGNNTHCYTCLKLKVPIVPRECILNPKHGGIAGICTCSRAVWSFSVFSAMTAL